ncbi:MAG: Holliday junction branch migration protein RuvA [Patescibacteria group bacterium]
MLAYLHGKINYKSNLLKKDNFLVVDVGGVGYKVFVPDVVLNRFSLSQEIELYVYTQVAETALDLYGFLSREELEFFELLLTISGIGPRSALDILKKAKIDDIIKAIQTGNYEVLSKVSGLGPKTAQKIVVGLKDKIGGVDQPLVGDWDSQFGDALEALIGLGYLPGQAREALSGCQATDAGEKIKEALKILGKK